MRVTPFYIHWHLLANVNKQNKYNFFIKNTRLTKRISSNYTNNNYQFEIFIIQQFTNNQTIRFTTKNKKGKTNVYSICYIHINIFIVFYILFSTLRYGAIVLRLFFFLDKTYTLYNIYIYDRWFCFFFHLYIRIY